MQARQVYNLCVRFVNIKSNGDCFTQSQTNQLLKKTMDTEASVILSAFKFISRAEEHICRLCFASSQQHTNYIQDPVLLKRPYYHNTVTYEDMFEELGITDEPYLPQTLCDSCAKTMSNSFLFKKLCEYSNEKWGEVLVKLENSLTQANTLSPAVCTAYLMINKTDNYIFTSRKTHRHDRQTAVSKIKRIIKNRSNYVQNKATDLMFICEECGMRYKSKVLLVKHMKAHNNTPQPCPQCFKTFSSPLNLAEHAERVHYPKKIQCDQCSKMFSTERMLRTHKRLEHIAAICKLCFVQFPSRTALKFHLDKHYILKCLQCNKSFMNRQTHRTHSKHCGNTQDKVLSFFCDLCGKGYIRKNGLRTHLKTDHGFGKVLTCGWCSKKFDAISRLKNHIVKHTRERNFNCGQCGGKFVTQAALVYHTRLHTGEKPFHCDLCDESFLSASRRMEHKRRKHFGPTKECHICHVKFVTGSQLRKHVERHSDPHSKLYVPVADKAGRARIIKFSYCL